MIPFNRPHVTGREFLYLQQAVENGQLAGNGEFTRRCQAWLQDHFGCRRVLLTHSCTAALEMIALLLDTGPGDEVIMPSFTFVSTANAFVLRGATPVFVDIRDDTLNLDERLVEAAISSRTRAIVAVHYAGVGCDMDALAAIAQRHGIALVEDAAQGFMSSYKGRPLGSLADLSAISFHETKNVISGEGGALVINNARFIERAEVLWEKGTDRSRFFRGEVDRYTWVDVGSSYLPGELMAAFLWAQLEQALAITDCRRALWQEYYQASVCLERAGLSRPVVPQACRHNAHLFWLLLPRGLQRAELLAELHRQAIHAIFHYVPLHSSPAGRRFGRVCGGMKVTDDISERLLRLPLWVDMNPLVPREIVAEVAAIVGVQV